MKKNKIIKKGSKAQIVPNWEVVSDCKAKIMDMLFATPISRMDAIMAVTVLGIELGYNFDLKKPQYLNHVSSLWEELDREAEGVTVYVKDIGTADAANEQTQRHIAGQFLFQVQFASEPECALDPLPFGIGFLRRTWEFDDAPGRIVLGRAARRSKLG